MVAININNNKKNNNSNQDILNPQKYLVVDDEIALNENDREDFILDMGISEDLALFASSYDEALEILNSHSDIAICYLDCKIPKSQKKLYDFNPTNSEKLPWGISLIPQINQFHKQTEIVVYSAYINISYLAEKVKQYTNIIGCYEKPNGLDNKKALYDNAVQKRLVSDQELPLDVLDYSSNSSAFDYSLLDNEVQLFVKERAKLIKKKLRSSAQDIIDIGKYLVEVKSSLKHGEFYPWIEAELQWSPTSAVRFMRVYKRLESVDLKNITNLEVFPSALYQLTANSIPDSAIIEMKQLAEAGMTINLEAVETIKKRHKKPKKKQPNQDRSHFVDRSRSQLPVPVQIEQPKEADQDNRSISDSKQEATSIKQNIVKVIPRQNQWRLGNHLLVCAEPNSSKFIDHLKGEVSLCLCFPLDKHWSLKSDLYKSKMSFYSQYQDLDPVPLFQSIEKIIEITTNEMDSIMICYIPHPKILTPIIKLGCIAYIAEPNYQKCLSLVSEYSALNQPT